MPAGAQPAASASSPASAGLPFDSASSPSSAARAGTGAVLVGSPSPAAAGALAGAPQANATSPSPAPAGFMPADNERAFEAIDQRPLSDADYEACVADWVTELAAFDPEAVRFIPGWSLIVALDVDGTIMTPDGQVSPRMRAAITGLSQAGAHVIISTGRGIQAAVPVALEVGLTRGWVVCANGAVTLCMDEQLPGGWEIVEALTFDPAPAIDTLAAAFPEGIIAVEDTGAGFRTSALFPEGEIIEEQVVVSLQDLRSQPVTRVVLRAPGMPLEEFTEAVAATGLHSVEYAIGWTAWLDIAPEGVTKASALEAMTKRLKTSASHVIAVGDGANDIDMLRWAGLGVAMGSAPQHVVEAADARTRNVWQDGCAALLDAVLARVPGDVSAVPDGAPAMPASPVAPTDRTSITTERSS